LFRLSSIYPFGGIDFELYPCYSVVHDIIERLDYNLGLNKKESKPAVGYEKELPLMDYLKLMLGQAMKETPEL
jgi:hypothetical protein